MHSTVLIILPDMERLRSQLALAAFLQELGEAVEQAEVVNDEYYFTFSVVRKN